VIYLQVGKRLFKSEGVHTVRFVAADTSNGLPFRKEHFDFVFFSYYSSCGGHRFDLMHDIHRVMRPGAFLLLCSCTPLYPKQRPSRNFDHWIWIENADQLRQEISVCGFGLIESETDPERPEYRFSMLRSLKGE
jgi:ubiquinone/menaquinone biosynthesis C-methylase UbiE